MKLHGGGTAACVTVYVWPPMVTVAVRAAPAFAVTAMVTVVVPVPLAGVIVVHAESLDAVHAHVGALAVSVAAEELAP